MRLLALCILVVLGCIGYAQAQQIFQNQQTWLDDNIDPDAALAMLESDSVSSFSATKGSSSSKGGLPLPPIHTTHFAKDTAHLPHHEQIIAAHTSVPPTREIHPDQDAALMEVSSSSTWVNPREHHSFTGHSMRRRMAERLNRHGHFGSASAGVHHKRLLDYAVHYNAITGQVSPGALQQLQEESAAMSSAAHPASLKDKIMMELEAEKNVKDPSALAASALEEENVPRRHTVPTTPFEGATTGRRPSPVLTLDRLHGRDHVQAKHAPSNELEAADAAFLETTATQKRMNKRFPTFHPRAPTMADLPRHHFSPMQLSFFPHDRHSFLQQSSSTHPKPLGRTPPIMLTSRPSDRAPAFAPAPVGPAHVHYAAAAANKKDTQDHSLAEVHAQIEQTAEAEAEAEAEQSTEAEAEQEAQPEPEAEAEQPAAVEPKFSLSELKSALSTLAPPSLVPMYNPMMMPMPIAYAPMPMAMPQQAFGNNPLLAMVEQLQKQQAAKQETTNNSEDQWYWSE